ncbi:MAG: hypothetical protein V1803_02975 [Candidatus Roizmanbacteria bacterium]
MPEAVSAPTAEISRVPRGLEGIKQQELKAHMESGKTKAAQLSSVAGFSDQIEGQLGTLITEAGTKVEQTKSNVSSRFKEVKTQRENIGKEISTAKKQRKDLGKQEGRLKKLTRLTTQVEAAKSDVIAEAQPEFEKEVSKLHSTAENSLQTVNKAKIEANQRETEARGKKRAQNYRKALGEELGKIPDNISARWNKRGLDGAMRVVEETSESLPTYFAGQEILALSVQEQVKPGQPIEDTFYKSAESLDKAVKATRKEELRLARKIDKAVKDPSLKKGRLTETVRGAHVQEDLTIQKEAQQIITELSEGNISNEAVVSAANRVRKLIEQPGLGKRSLGDSLLTAEALDRARKEKDIVDPVRKLVYNSLSGRQKSVEEVLGCEITVNRDEKGRLIDIKLPEERDAEESVQTGKRETKLFTRLAQIESVEDGLKKRFNEVEPGNIVEVRTLSQALESVGKERAALLKLANARINGIFTADSVRSGEIKTRLADVGVKAGEAGVVTAVAAGATYLGVHSHIEAAQNVVSKANTLIAPLREVIQNGPDLVRGLMEGLKGVNLADIQTAIQSGSTSELFNKAQPFMDAYNKIQTVSQQMNLAPDQINAITNGALQATAAEKMGAMKDLVIGSGATAVTALSFTEGIRKIAGAPGRGIRSLYHHIFG